MRHPNKSPDWTAEEEARALALAESGLRYRAIAATMAGEGFPTRTATGVERIVHALGYRRGWGRAWTLEEEDALRSEYHGGRSLTALALRLGRRPGSMTWKAQTLGLSGTHPRPNGFRQGPEWTAAEIDYVRRFYPFMRARLIAEKLGRPVGAVYNKAHQLGLDSGYCRDFSEEERRAIALARSHGISLTDLSEALDRDPAVVSKQAIRLGLPFNDRAIAAPRSKRATRRTWVIGDILALPTS